MQPQVLESEHLLHELQDVEEKKKDERRRQLDMIAHRREQVKAKLTPRSQLASGVAALSKTSQPHH